MNLKLNQKQKITNLKIIKNLSGFFFVAVLDLFKCIRLKISRLNIVHH